MGKLILCSSVIAKQPYCFPMTRTRVYTIEEVCYYIRNNIYMMQEEVFDQEFAIWLRRELGMEETADKLDRMRRDQNNLKDIVVTLCCSCDYYTEPEIQELIRIMDETKDLPARERQRIRADSYLRGGSLERARREYEHILRDADMLNADSGEYAQIYRRMGAASAGMGDFCQAAQAFQKAYEYDAQKDSLEACLYCLRLSGDHQEYQRTLREMQVTTEQKVFWEAQYEETMRLCAQERECRQVRRIRRQQEQGDPAWKKEAQACVLRWKQEYRKSMQQ